MKANSCKVLASLWARTNLADVVKEKGNSTYAKASADEGRDDRAMGDRAIGRKSERVKERKHPPVRFWRACAQELTLQVL